MSLRLIKPHARKVYMGKDVQSQAIVASQLVGDELSASITGQLTPGEGPLTSIKHDAG
jgi:hypothetical protein